MGEQSDHALLSASGAPRWTRCYGSIALESTTVRRGSKYAAEGTAAHGLAAFLLSGQPNKEITDVMALGYAGHEGPMRASDWIGAEIVADGDTFTVDAEFAEHVQAYVDYVRSLGGILLVETKVNYANWLGVPTKLAGGTSDAIAIHDGETIICIDERGYLVEEAVGQDNREGWHTGRLLATTADLKFGVGVPVYPEHNEQGMLYTGGALNEIELMTEVFDTDIIRIVIHQPRAGEGAPLEWYITVGALKKWLKVEAAMAAQHAVKLYEASHDPDNVVVYAQEDVISVVQNELTPGDKQCRFCNAKAICPALTQHAVNTVADQFVDLDAEDRQTLPKIISAADVKSYEPVSLAEKMRAAPILEAWIKAVRAEVENELLTGNEIPGFKLVRGKQGNRNWADEAVALKTLKRVFGAKDAVKPETPISPTAAEKLVKAKGISERQWKAICENVTQSEGGISVALESDKRPAYVPQLVVEAAFTEITAEEADDLSHLA